MEGSRTDLVNVERWTILALSCVVLFGQSFCYDIPASVHDHLLSYSGLGDDAFPWYFNAMYSAYSLPNLVLPLAFGWVSDKTTACTIIFSLSIVACVGQLILSVGMTAIYPLDILNRRCKTHAVAYDSGAISFRCRLRIAGCRGECDANSCI